MNKVVMGELIDKTTVVAEIERRIKINKECMLGLRNLDYYQGKVDALNDTISFLDTLEVKENLTWKDIRELYIIFAEVDVEIESGKCDIQTETVGYYQEVLKRLKSHKGE